MWLFFCAFILQISTLCHAVLYPIHFSLSEDKIVKEIPKKTQDFATVIPGNYNTYIFHEEDPYYADYQKSYFGLTMKKGGWDCMRHYEILANGCIPYFLDLDKCDENTMHFFPRELIDEAMHLPGVSFMHIDHSRFDEKRYYEILSALLEHTRTYFTSKKTAEYVLKSVHYTGTGKILFLSHDVSPDYMRCCTLIGLKQLLGERVIDYPKIDHIYKNYTLDTRALYGRGFTYTRILEDLPIDRKNIRKRIRNKEFDLIIYGSVHRGMRYHDLVRQVYGPDQILYICGEDYHRCEYTDFPHFFLREFEAVPH